MPVNSNFRSTSRAEGPCGVTCQHVDLARSQRCKACFTGCRNEFNSACVAQNSSCNSAAYSETSKPFHSPFASGAAKPTRPVVTPQFSLPRALTSSNGTRSSCASRKAGNCCHAQDYGFFHFYLFLIFHPLAGRFDPARTPERLPKRSLPFSGPSLGAFINKRQGLDQGKRLVNLGNMRCKITI